MSFSLLIFKEIVDEVDFALLLVDSLDAQSGRGSAGRRRMLLNDGERISWSFMSLNVSWCERHSP